MGEYIVPIPHVKQVKVSPLPLVAFVINAFFYTELSVFSHLYIQLSDAGGRLIIASDGIWDILSSDMAAKACRGLSAQLAAKLVVKVWSSTNPIV